jgi:hypothetical protein
VVDARPRFFAPGGREVCVTAPDARKPLRLSAEDIDRHRLTLLSRRDGARPDHGAVLATLC